MYDRYHNDTYKTAYKVDDFYSYTFADVWGGTAEDSAKKVHDFLDSPYFKGGVSSQVVFGPFGVFWPVCVCAHANVPVLVIVTALCSLPLPPLPPFSLSLLCVFAAASCSRSKRGACNAGEKVRPGHCDLEAACYCRGHPQVG